MPEDGSSPTAGRSIQTGMTQRSETLCITCGLAVGETPRLNRLSNGQICPTCLDRAMDSIPPALPSPSLANAGQDAEASALRDGMYGAEDWDDPTSRRGA